MSLSKQTPPMLGDDILGQLLYSQKEAARFLQIGYLSLRDFPELAEQIRMSADQAETQHMETVGLINEFGITSAHVRNRTVPILKKAIEKRASEMVQATLEKLLEYVENMVIKTERKKEKYAEIKSIVQQNISYVKKTQMEVKKDEVVADSELNQRMQELEIARSEYWNLQAEREKIETDIRDLYTKRYEYLNQAVPSEEDKERNDTTDNLILPLLAIEAANLAEGTAIVAAGSTAAFTAALLPGTILVGGWMYNRMRRNEESDRAFKASDMVAEDIKMKQEREDKAHDRILAIKEDSIRKIALIKENFIKKAFLGDPESLVQAKIQIENVGKHFQHMLEVWIKFAAQLNYLIHSKDDVELFYVGFKENPEGFVEELNQSVDNIKQVWQGFEDDCTAYQTESGREKDNLYGFLTEPVDEMSVEDCNEKRDAILEKMESELKQLSIGFTERQSVLYERQQ